MGKVMLINIRREGEQFLAEVPELALSATGSTFDDAELAAQKAIVEYEIAERAAKRNTRIARTHSKQQQAQAS